MANQFYSVNKEINGVTYTAQFNGISASLEAIDRSYIDGTNTISMVKLSKYLFENVIVSPRITLDEFGADKIGTVETKKIGGKEYKAEFKGMLNALKALDDSYIDGTNTVSMVKLSKYLFENVITEPKGIDADSFDNMDDFNEVITFAREVMQGGNTMDEFNEIITFAREVMQGSFREKADKGATTKKGAK